MKPATDCFEANASSARLLVPSTLREWARSVWDDSFSLEDRLLDLCADGPNPEGVSDLRHALMALGSAALAVDRLARHLSIACLRGPANKHLAEKD